MQGPIPLESEAFREGQPNPNKLFQWLLPCQEEGLPFWSAFVWPHSPLPTLAITHQCLQEAADQDGQRRLQPTKVQPILSLPPEQQEYFHSWEPSNILVESSQIMQWKLEPAAPLPCKLNFTKPQTGHLITLSWINKNSWAVLVSHGEADLWTNHKPCLSLFQDPFPLH